MHRLLSRPAVRTSLIVAVLALSALAGSLAGIADKASAVWTVKFVYTPPAGTTYSYNTCGWHNTCDGAYAWGVALDFTDWYGGYQVYFRSFGFSSNGGSWQAATGLRRTITGANCYQVEGWIDDTYGNIKAKMVYTHTEQWGSLNMPMNVNPYGYYNNFRIATMKYPDKATCPSSGYHVHEAHLNNFVSFYTRDGYLGCGVYPCNYSGKRTQQAVSDWWNNWTRAVEW
jgi:hypothetical protein